MSFDVLVRGSSIDLTSGIDTTISPAIFIGYASTLPNTAFTVSFPQPQNEFDAASSG